MCLLLSALAQIIRAIFTRGLAENILFVFSFQTTHTSLVVRDVGPGKWYQYRVAAVSINGTRSFTDPTKPLKLSKGEYIMAFRRQKEYRFVH